MSNTTETVRVVSTDPETQGPFVVINAAEFDPDVHTKYEPDTPAPAEGEMKRGPGRTRKQTGT